MSKYYKGMVRNADLFAADTIIQGRHGKEERKFLRTIPGPKKGWKMTEKVKVPFLSKTRYTYYIIIRKFKIEDEHFVQSSKHV